MNMLNAPTEDQENVLRNFRLFRDVLRDLGPNIRAARTGLGMSQADLAEAADLSLLSIQGYEVGRNKPRPDALMDVVNALVGEWERQKGAGE